MLMAEASSDSSIRTAQWDCTSAFLHAPVDYEMFMRQPEGFEVCDGDGAVRGVCKLLRALYGCKQASRLFHKEVRDHLLGLGAVQSRADECLFIIREGTSWLKILVHVDDFAVTYNDRALYDRIFAAMKDRFRITDYGGGEISRFVGICVDRTVEGFYRLHQQPYLEEVIARLGLDDAKHARSPERGGTKAKLKPLDNELTPAEKEFMDAVPYREAVGALFYLARATRFDIAHAAGQVARFLANPGPDHWKAVVRIYAYLARTKNVALVMKSSGMQCEVADQWLEGFSDSDWAGCQETRKSHTGWMVRVGGSLVAWYSKRQGAWAQSTCEAEYIAAASLANEVVWWRRLCEDMGYGLEGPITMWCDNRATVSLADHEGKFDAVKHIQIRYHIVRDYQHRGLVQVQWRCSNRMWADVLTKNCEPAHFCKLVSEIMGERV